MTGGTTNAQEDEPAVAVITRRRVVGTLAGTGRERFRDDPAFHEARAVVAEQAGHVRVGADLRGVREPVHHPRLAQAASGVRERRPGRWVVHARKRALVAAGTS